jgi:hypothetical protein
MAVAAKGQMTTMMAAARLFTGLFCLTISLAFVSFVDR